MIAKKPVADLFSAGRHASTFGGNFLATAAANAVIDAMVAGKMDRQAAEKGEILAAGLRTLKGKYAEFISEVKGLGLMRGLQLTEKIDAAGVVVKARQKGLIAGTAGKNVLRFLPALVITAAEIKEALAILDEVFYEYLVQDKPLFQTIRTSGKRAKKKGR
jgi:acetylornithine/succinyldiaminopimelate/putrescine aminotransferase